MAAKPVKHPEPRPELLGLLRACKESPEDDAPRLILADWLDDNARVAADAARAEAIRLGCDDARLPEGDEREGLEEKARELLVRHHREWLGPLEPYCGRWYFAVERGLLHVTARGGEVLTKAGAALAGSEEWNWVDSFRLGTFAGDAGLKLLASGLLPSLNTLDLSNTECDWRSLKPLVDDRQVAGLRKLRLNQTRVWDRGLRALAGSRHLANLRSLSLQSASLGEQRLAELASSKQLPGLRELDLARNNLSLRELTPLLQAEALGPLARLNLFQNHLGDEGLAVLAANPRFAALEDLDVSCNVIEDPGAVALASAPLTKLRRLDLHGNFIREAGARALAASPALARLDHLDFRNNKAGRRGNAALRERFGDRVTI